MSYPPPNQPNNPQYPGYPPVDAAGQPMYPPPTQTAPPQYPGYGQQQMAQPGYPPPSQPYPGYAQQPSQPYPGYPPQPGQPYPGQPYPGYPQPPYGQMGMPQMTPIGFPESNPRADRALGSAIVSIVLAVLSVFLLYGYAGFISGTYAIIFGFRGLRDANKLPRKTGHGKAIAAIIMGFAAWVLLILSIILTAAVGS